jgi:hypothetical protein
MPAQTQDWILRQIELLRQFVARLMHDRDPAGIEEALQLAFNLQERLFSRPAPEFLRLAVHEQIAALRAGGPSAAADEKCLTYATLLGETANLYQLRGRDDLAAGARQLALHVALSVALDGPMGSPAAVALVRELTGALSPDALHAPVREMLERFNRQT